MRRIRTGNDGFRRRSRAPWIALTVVTAAAALLVGAVGKSSASIPNPYLTGSATLSLNGCKNDGSITLPSRAIATVTYTP